MEFVLPLKFDHLLEQPSDSKYWVQEYSKVSSWDEKRQQKQLEKIIDELFKDPEVSLQIFRYFDILYSFIHQIDKLTADSQEKLINIVVVAFNNVINLSEKNAGSPNELLDCFKMYEVLFYGIFTKCKTIKSEKCLKVVNRSLNIINKLYLPEKPEGRLVEMIIEIVFTEIERGKEDEICEIMKWVKETEKTDIWVGWRAKAVNILIGETENCVKPIVNIVKNEPSLINELLSSLAEAVLANDQITETQGVKNVGLFIEKLTSKLPKEMLMNVSVIVSLLNSEAYSLRNSVVASIGEILCFIIRKDMDHSAEKDTYTNYREQLLGILRSRILDKSSYCRNKVVEAFFTLNKDDLLPRDWFMPVLEIASSRLLDSAAIVRKKATTLLESLIYHNKLLEGNVKIEPRENIEKTYNKHKKWKSYAALIKKSYTNR